MIKLFQPIAWQEIERVKISTDIVELARRYLKPTSMSNFREVFVPGNSETSYILYVSGEQQLFYDPFKKISGDVFDFLSLYSGLRCSFREAIIHLAEESGVRLRGQDRAPTESTVTKERLLEINRWGEAFFHANLLENDNLLEELSLCGIDKSVACKFKLGYATPSYNTFLKHAHANSFNNRELSYAGLIRRSNRKKSAYYDSFRDRFVIPICDVEGRVAGFAHQVSVANAAETSWCLSRTNTLFKTKRLMFGLNEARQAMRALGKVYLVPEYHHVLWLQRLSIQNTICVCGDVFTQFHAEAIKTWCNTLVVLEDSKNNEPANYYLDAMIAQGFHVESCLIDQLDNTLKSLRTIKEFQDIVKKNSYSYLISLMQKALSMGSNSQLLEFLRIIGIISKTNDDQTRCEFVKSFSIMAKMDVLKIQDAVVQKRIEYATNKMQRLERKAKAKVNARGEFEILKFFFLPEDELAMIGGWQAIVVALGNYKFKVQHLKNLFKSLRHLFSSGVTPTFEELFKLDNSAARTSKTFCVSYHRVKLYPLNVKEFNVLPEFITIINYFKLKIIRQKLINHELSQLNGSKCGWHEIINLERLEKIHVQQERISNALTESSI